MAINLYEGTPGSGKTYSAIYKIIECLQAGKRVATNIRFKDGWEQKLASRSLSRLWGRDVFELSKMYKENFHRVLNTEELIKFAAPLVAENKPEGSGIFVFDEAALTFNSRTFNKSGQFDWVEIAILHRKLRIDCIYIAQDTDAVDKQIRSLAEYVYSWRNLQKVRLKYVGFPLFPFWPVFNYVRFMGGTGAGSGESCGFGFVPLFPSIANFYETHEISGGMSEKLHGLLEKSVEEYKTRQSAPSVLQEDPPRAVYLQEFFEDLSTWVESTKTVKPSRVVPLHRYRQKPALLRMFAN